MTIIKITKGEPGWKIINMWCGHKLMTALMSLLQKYKQPNSVAPGVIYFFLCWCEISLVVDEPRRGRSKSVFKSGQTKVVPRDEQPRSPSLVQQSTNRKFIFSYLLNIYMIEATKWRDNSDRALICHLPPRLAACQCNGHSTCVNGSVCEQCRNLTTGPHCQTCMPGYHGDPTNGGKCQGEFTACTAWISS